MRKTDHYCYRHGYAYEAAEAINALIERRDEYLKAVVRVTGLGLVRLADEMERVRCDYDAAVSAEDDLI